LGKNCGSHQTTTAAGRRLKEKKKGMRLRWGWVGSNSRRGSSSGGVVLDFNPMTHQISVRNRLISSLTSMFNEVHDNETAPSWLVELHNKASDDELRKRMSNWQRNYPSEWQRHGIYCM
jgi:hypothetical protein